MSFINDPTRAFSPILKVTAFSDIEMTSEQGSLLLPYDASTMESSFSNVICQPKTIDATNGGGDFKGSNPSDLKINFLLDDTTYSNLIAFALPSMLIPDRVDMLIKKLIELCHTKNEATEQPNYVRLKPFGMALLDSPGGGFNGRLLSMNIKNDLVNLTGDRVKARVECVFKEKAQAATS
ncbi:CIS tube protein [Pseudomonas sp. HK3]